MNEQEQKELSCPVCGGTILRQGQEWYCGTCATRGYSLPNVDLTPVHVIHDATCVDGDKCLVQTLCSYHRDAVKAVAALEKAGFLFNLMGDCCEGVST